MTISVARATITALLVSFLGVSAALAGSPTPAPYVLAVHPYLPAPELQRRFRPLAELMGRVLGREVIVRVGQDYSEHHEAIGRDRVDIAFLGPVPYVLVRRDYGPKPMLARFEVNHQTQLRGVIFVPRDSPLRTVADLKGKRFAFADRYSTMGHVVPEWVMAQAGVPVGSLAFHQFLASHEDVVLAVLAGDYDGGAVKQEVFEQFNGRGLRALADLPTTPDHVFVTRSSLPAAEVAKLRDALLGLKDRPGGAAILERLHPGLTALVPTTDADYDPVRRMLIDSESLRHP